MRVLVACEFSGIVREAFRRRGHDAWSCDLLPTEIPGKHMQGDVLAILNQGWDLIIAHPPCTYLCVSGARWFEKNQEKQEKAIDFFLSFVSKFLVLRFFKKLLNSLSSFSLKFLLIKTKSLSSIFLKFIIA
jgi:hypothetical protein